MKACTNTHTGVRLGLKEREGSGGKEREKGLTIEVGCVGKRGCLMIARIKRLKERTLKQESLRLLLLRRSDWEDHQRELSSTHQRRLRVRDKRGLVGSLSASEV